MFSFTQCFIHKQSHLEKKIFRAQMSSESLPPLPRHRIVLGFGGVSVDFGTYVVCSAKFPQAWTDIPSVPSVLVSMLLRLPKLKFVIVTLDEDGCIMLERSVNGLTKVATRLTSNGTGTVTGRLFVGAAEKIPPSELVDTTGAGDAFIGAVLYYLSASMPPETMLPFAAQVAAAGCRALGARTGLPLRTYPRLASFL